MARRDPSDDFRLPKSEVIWSSREIGEVFRKGRRYTGKHISISCTFHPRAAEDRLRVAFTVSRKVRRAVDRNRFKRLMREVYRLNREKTLSVINAGGRGSRIVISCICQSPATTVSLKDIEEDFKHLLRRIGNDVAGNCNDLPDPVV